MISASVEKVFEFLDVPENGLALIPQLVEVKDVAPLPNGGHRLKVLVPLMEFQSRRGMRSQLRRLLEVVKARVEAGQE